MSEERSLMASSVSNKDVIAESERDNPSSVPRPACHDGERSELVSARRVWGLENHEDRGCGLMCRWAKTPVAVPSTSTITTTVLQPWCRDTGNHSVEAGRPQTRSASSEKPEPSYSTETSLPAAGMGNKEVAATTWRGGVGALSLENLLRESQQQLKELLWYKSRCRTLQAALDTAEEQHKALEDALLDARVAVLGEREQHRAFVAASAEELRSTRASLELRADATRAMENELGGLRREVERCRKLLELADADRIASCRRQKRVEEELTRVLSENEQLRRDVDTYRRNRDGCEDLQEWGRRDHGSKFGEYCPRCESASDGNHDNKKSENISGEITEGRVCGDVLMLQEALNRRTLEMSAVQEREGIFRQHLQRAVVAASRQLLTLQERGAFLCRTPATEVVGTNRRWQDAVMDGDPVVTLHNCIERLERQWGTIEVLGKRQHEEVARQRMELEQKQQEQLNVMACARAAEKKALCDAAQLGEQLHQLDICCTCMWRAMERQSRMLLTTIASKKKNREMGVSQDESEEDEDISAQQQLPEKKHPYDLVSCEKKVRQVHRATRCMIRQLGEARLQQDTLSTKMQEERRQLLALRSEERVRHQHTVKRLHASLKTSQDTETALQAQLTAAARTAEAERQALLQRLESMGRELQEHVRQERALRQTIHELQLQCESRETEFVKSCEKIAAFEKKLAVQQGTMREEEFDIKMLRDRCDDLVRMVNALEAHAEREERGQTLLYELVRQLCSALAILMLRLSVVSAERRAMCRIYEAQDADRRAALLLQQELMDEVQELGTTLHRRFYRSQRSLASVVAAVVACGRMHRLMQRRRRKRHATLEVGGCSKVGACFPPLPHYTASNSALHMAAPNSLRRLAEGVFLAHAAFRQEPVSASMPIVQLPPPPALCTALASVGEDVAAGGFCALETILTLAVLDPTAEENRFYFEVNAPLATALTLNPQPCLRRCVPQQERRYDGYSRPTLTQEMYGSLLAVRRFLSELSGQMRQKDVLIQQAEKENRHLVDTLQKCEKNSTGFAQRLHDYEQHVATSYVRREEYHQLQQRLSAAHDALQQERVARRHIEDANAVLHQRDVELTRVMQHMKDEMRSLSIELVKQQKPISNIAASTRLRESRIVNGSRVSLYVPRSVKTTEGIPFASVNPSAVFSGAASAAGGDGFTDDAVADGDDVGGTSTDEVMLRIISDIESRLANAGGATPHRS